MIHYTTVAVLGAWLLRRSVESLSERDWLIGIFRNDGGEASPHKACTAEDGDYLTSLEHGAGEVATCPRCCVLMDEALSWEP